MDFQINNSRHSAKAAAKATVLIEVIVDQGVGGGEFLQGLYILELRHRSFALPERLI